MGFSLVYGGWNGVLWHQETGTFPYTKGFLPVVLSWFFSPIVGGILASIIFALNRTCILRRKAATTLAIWSVPILVFVTVYINLLFVLAKVRRQNRLLNTGLSIFSPCSHQGAKPDMQKTWPCSTQVGYHGISYTDCSALNNAAAWIAACAAAGCSVICGAIFIPYLFRQVKRDRQM